MIMWASNIPALINTLPAKTCPIVVRTIPINPTVPIWLHIPTLPILTVCASPQRAPIYTFALNASLPVIRALLIGPALCRRTVVIETLLIFGTNERHLMAWLIKIVQDCTVFACLTWSDEIDSTSVGFDPTETWGLLHKVVNHRTGRIVWSRHRACCRSICSLCRTDIKI